MELTDRERKILADLERQLDTGDGAATARRRTVRPQWTVRGAAVLGPLLLTVGMALGITEAVVLGVLSLVWWLCPLMWKLLRAAGRFVASGLRSASPL